MSKPLKLYSELAGWFHLLTSPADYVEEAESVRQILTDGVSLPPKTVLELGSGGGNNAVHLKKQFQMTLVDLSPQMLELSRTINPECEHRVGDMKTIRLEREFDAVLIHDAIMYMTTEDELRQAIETARVHCRPGGSVLILPDYVKETLKSCHHHGGHDGKGRALRYQEWTFDPDPLDTTYEVDFAYMLREGAGPVRVLHDRHTFGIFPRAVWLRLLAEGGFEAECITDPYSRDVFLGTRT